MEITLCSAAAVKGTLWLKVETLLAQGLTPTRNTPGGGLTAHHGSDMLLDCDRPAGPRKVSLKDARGAPMPRLSMSGPKPRLSASALMEEALRQKEADAAQSPPQPPPLPADHKSAAANLWQFPGGVRSLDPAAHGDWARMSLCEPPPHMKHLINAAKINAVEQQQPQPAAPPVAQDYNKPWAARRSIDCRRSMAGRGIRTGAAERVSGCGRGFKQSVSVPLPEEESPIGSPPAGGSPPARESPPSTKNEAAPAKPAKKVSFGGGKKVDLEEGFDALRLSLLDSPKAGSPGAALAYDAGAKPAGNESDLQDLHSIGRTLPRVRVTLSK